MKLPKPSDSNADFVIVDEGVYRMEFTKYEGPLESTFRNDDGSPKFRVKLFFTIRDDESDFDGEVVSQYFGYSMHPTKSKLYPIVKAIAGREPDEDEELDLDELLGRIVMGTVGHDKKVKDGQERIYANLVSASPVRKKKSAAAPPPPPVEEDDPFEEEEDAA